MGATYSHKYTHTAVYSPDRQPAKQAPIDYWRATALGLCLMSAIGVVGALLAFFLALKGIRL